MTVRKKKWHEEEMKVTAVMKLAKKNLEVSPLHLKDTNHPAPTMAAGLQLNSYYFGRASSME